MKSVCPISLVTYGRLTIRESNENKGRGRYKGCCRDIHTASQTPRMADEAIDGVSDFDNGRFSDGISG